MERQYEDFEDEQEGYETGEMPEEEQQYEDDEVQSQEPEQAVEDVQEEYEDEEEEQPKKRMPGNARIQQLTREKYQAVNEANRANQEAGQWRQEVERLQHIAQTLKEKADKSGLAAIHHYEKGVKNRLDKAYEKKKKAIEDDDSQGQAEADMEIIATNNELQQISAWRADRNAEERHPPQQQYEQPYYPQNQVPQYQKPSPMIAQTWGQMNSWINPNSPDFNVELAYAVNDYSEKLENVCYRMGRPDLILSEEYFHELDKFVNAQRKSGNNGRQLNMKPVNGGVSPVRNGGNGRPQKKHVQLTPQEKEVAKMFGQSDEKYLNAKLKSMKRIPHRWK